MSTPPGALSGDTLMPPGATRPELRPVADESFPRPWPTDPPGARDAAGWLKTDASGPGGWRPIDDAEGADTPMWRQC